MSENDVNSNGLLCEGCRRSAKLEEKKRLMLHSFLCLMLIVLDLHQTHLLQFTHSHQLKCF